MKSPSLLQEILEIISLYLFRLKIFSFQPVMLQIIGILANHVFGEVKRL